MKCPDEGTWILFAEEEITNRAELAAHLQNCEKCATLLAKIKTMGKLLLAAGPTSGKLCPTRDKLADFVEGLVSHSSLIHHIACCPKCKREVDDYRALVPPTNSAETIWATIREGAASLLALGEFQLAPQTLGKLRSSRQKQSGRIVKKWGNSEVTIHFSPRVKNCGFDMTIVISPEPDEEARIRVELYSQDRLVEARSMPMSGKLVMDELTEGSYILKIRDLVDGQTVELNIVTLLD